MHTLNFPHLTFTNRFSAQLPADPTRENSTRFVSHVAFSWVMPKLTKKPQVIATTDELLSKFELDSSLVPTLDLDNILTGNKLITGMQPYAMCYGGHQFGHWAGQLGDGRAINLGEIKVDEEHFTLQLKGAGPTPYSRSADGLAVLRSSIREFLCSEAMYNLGISTTRALSLALTGDSVVRDMFYNGNAKAEQGAVVCRVSSSFLRFGSFQLPCKQGDAALLKQLVDYCIKHDYPEISFDENNKDSHKEAYIAWFKSICDKTCTLVVDWMRVGFVHGVMNTDNMSIIGETIDYGPYGWIDAFDLNWTPNTTDKEMLRYRFGAQAKIAQWNLFQLANAILPLIEEAEPLENLLNEFSNNYQHQWQEMMAKKLGLTFDEAAGDLALIESLESLLSSQETDMTIFYRSLSSMPFNIDKSDESTYYTKLLSHFNDCFYNFEAHSEEYITSFNAWMTTYIERVNNDVLEEQERIKLMDSVNPIYVLRNYLAQQAIEKAEQGDYSEIKILQKLLKTPYTKQAGFERYAEKRPTWAANKAGCSMLSCSS